MMGCCHNPEQNCRNPRVPYAFGYWIPGTGKRTIMAYVFKYFKYVLYPNDSELMTRLRGPKNPIQTMYFSSPTYRIDGVKAGTGAIDCRRSHLEHMTAISQLGDESSPSCETTTGAGMKKIINRYLRIKTILGFAIATELAM